MLGQEPDTDRARSVVEWPSALDGTGRLAHPAGGTGVLVDQNALLAQFPERLLRQLKPHWSLTELRRGDRLDFSASQEFIYFPISGILVLYVALNNKETIFLRLLDRHAAIVVTDVLELSDFGFQARVFKEGYFYRIRRSAFYDAFDSHGLKPSLLDLTRKLLIKEIAQAAVCASSHPLQQRLARLLMNAFESVENGQFVPTTQQKLSDLLVVRRETIANLFRELRAEGVLQTSRGSVQIRDVESLRRQTCSCYAFAQKSRHEAMNFWVDLSKGARL